MKNKKLSFLICFLFIMITVSAFSIALADTGEDQVNQAVSNLNNGINEYAILQEVLGYLAWFAFIVAIFKLIQIGIGFLTGVVSRKSDAKSAMIPWLIGAAVCALFGVLGPWFIGLIAKGDTGNIFDSTTASSSSTQQQTNTNYNTNNNTNNNTNDNTQNQTDSDGSHERNEIQINGEDQTVNVH